MTAAQGIRLGVGRLSWEGRERRSDRYGSVGLCRDGSGPWKPLASDGAGGEGSLVAVVIETRDSQHIGDLFRGFFPVTPTVGERITLGTGTFFQEGDCVGLEPADERTSDWLDPKALYRVHDQTVELYFVPSTEHHA